MKRITGFLVALLFAGTALADLSSLNVQFNPIATSYMKGTVVGLTATSNGTNAQYKFNVHRMVAGQATLVMSSEWSSTNTTTLDTNAVNVLAGRYRIQAMARESANASETLVKTEIINVTAPPVVTACESVEGKTYSNDAPAMIPLGDLTLAGALELQSAGVPLEFGGGGAQHVRSIRFQDDLASVSLASLDLRVCVFLCMNVAARYSAPVQLPYTCAGNAITVNAAGTMSQTEMDPSVLSDLLGGGTMPVIVTGELQINAGGSSVSADGVTLD
jgi:hypothetical protein